MQIAYLLGIPRSGTTLLSALLNQHPEIYCPAEPWTMLAAASLGRVPAAHPADSELIRKASAKHFENVDLHRHVAMQVYSGMLADKSATWLVDKTPRYHHCLDYIAATVPDAKYLWIVRNPLDVAASYKSTWNNDIVGALRDGADHPITFDFALGFRRLLNFSKSHNVHVVHYEELVASPATVMSNLFNDLGLPQIEFDDNIAGGMQPLLGSAFGDVKIAETSGVHTQSVGRYVDTLGEEPTRLLCAMLGRQLLSELGYPDLYDRHDAGSIEGASELPGSVERQALQLVRTRDSLSRRPYSYWQRQRELTAAYGFSMRRARNVPVNEVRTDISQLGHDLGEGMHHVGIALEASQLALSDLGQQVAATDQSLAQIAQQILALTSSQEQDRTLQVGFSTELLATIQTLKENQIQENLTTALATLVATQDRDRASFMQAQADAAALADQLRHADEVRVGLEVRLAETTKEILALGDQIAQMRRSPFARLLGKN